MRLVLGEAGPLAKLGPRGEIGRHTGLKILGPQKVVPVQVWPRAPNFSHR